MNLEYKAIVCAASYIGTKGYTIPKSVLTAVDIEFLKKDLFLKPQTPGPSFGPALNDAFPVYRENDKKIYIPRFYGIERYGEPATNELAPGTDIDVPFTKELRDYQDKIVDIYMNSVSIYPAGGILEIYCGAGKCLGIDTPVMMFDGSIKLVQDIHVGDVLMGDDSTPRNVMTLARGKEMMYLVKSKKHKGYVVNESHILSLQGSSTYGTAVKKDQIYDLSVKEFLSLPNSFHGKAGPLLGYRVPIVFPRRDVEIDPYLLGYWIGDGRSSGTGISTQESTVLKYLSSVCFKEKHPTLYLQYTGFGYDYRINSILKGNGSNCLMNSLIKYSLINNKHIPDDYKFNERSVQLNILAGIIDSDGSYSNNCYDIIQKNERIMDDIIYIVRSLGFSAFKQKTTKTCTNSKNGPVTGTYYRANVHGSGLEEIPVKCIRKQAHVRKQIKNSLRYRIELEKLGVDDYYGFEIDGNRRFVLGDHTVTHNTVMALKIVSLLKKKTLILVHKEFLMNQWIERIAEFLPTARVGKIQANVCDCEDKDIVIGMIQTMYNKVFPQEVYSQFGMTIIDEVHRIGSEEFSKTLLKTITPYMLGISATVERKDKLTKLLYMFIGPKLHSMLRKQEDTVLVRGIEFQTNDEEFNEVERDFRGQPKYSTMISKLCAYGPRTRFIVKVVQDLIVECPDSQIMILAHNRCLLTELSKALGSITGFYVGGMKQKDLDATELKPVVLATYAMAAEALDIKSLSTLVMVTPKTDITQSVGRILRMKHDKPIVVDIIDGHQLFQNQWKMRKRFYKKSNYKIETSTSKTYTNMTETSWFPVYDPKTKASSKCADDDDEKTVTEFEGKCCIDTSQLI